MTRFHRVIRPFAFVSAALATLAALFYALEDWRGARTWAAMRKALENQGESLDPNAFIPPPIPNDQNLAMAPIFYRALGYQTDARTRLLTFGQPSASPDPSTALLRELPFGPHQYQPRAPGLRKLGWSTGQRMDLGAWQERYRGSADFPHPAQAQDAAADVLLALTRYGPLLTELSEAAKVRPFIRFPVNWTRIPPAGINFPHGELLMKLTQTLNLRACAELDEGRDDLAYQDVQLTLRLRDGFGPILIETLFDCANLTIVLQAIWEGLAERRWSSAEIDGLREKLEQIDLLAESKQAARGGERAIFFCETMDYSKSNSSLYSALTRPFASESRLWFESDRGLFVFLMPAGWFDQNKAVGCFFLQKAIVDAIDPASHRIFAPRAAQAMMALENTHSKYSALARDAVPAYAHIHEVVAATQTYIDEAATACALEKYWLDKRGYPSNLTLLAPTYRGKAPTDILSGEQLQYCLTADERYQLKSPGWDASGAGGPVNDSENKPWVWQYTPLVTAK